MELQVVDAGATLGGKYRLTRQLDKGGMGAVWEAQHLLLGSLVAVKLMDSEIASNAQATNRFWREAQAAAALRSPHVVQVLDYGIEGAIPYIVMELLDGESLAARLSRQRLTPQEVSRILSDVARGVSKAHEAGIAHRDLKPENIYIVRNDDQELAKVLDFGIAKTPRMIVESLGAAPNDETDTGALLGTPNYMSPEQALGSRDLDYRTDIWSLGVIAFECLTGQRPFESETVGKLLVAICTEPIPIPSRVASVPTGFDAWFARACARAAEQRFQSAREAIAELRRVCDDNPAVGVPPSGSVPAISLRQRGAESQHPFSLTPTFNQARPRKRWPLALLVPLAIGFALAIWKRPPPPHSGSISAARLNSATSLPKDASPPTADSVDNSKPAAPTPLPSVSPSAESSVRSAPPSAAPRIRTKPAVIAKPSSPPPRPKPSEDEDLGI